MLCCQSKKDAEDKSSVVSYLLSKNAKVNVQDANGQTALIHAFFGNSGAKIIKALLDHKSNPWIEDKSNNTIFDYAINEEDLETTRLLISSCRENRTFPDSYEKLQIKHLEQCLANIQDMRKLSWPLVASSLRNNHTPICAADNDDLLTTASDMLGSKLNEGNFSPRCVRERKRSVCQFDPLCLETILNCSEDAKTNSPQRAQERERLDGEEQRKTSIRSLSEEEKFSFQLSDSEISPRDPSSGLEKLLKLQDSFSSSVDSNEFPYSSAGLQRDSIDKQTEFDSDEELHKGNTRAPTDVVQAAEDTLVEGLHGRSHGESNSCDRIFVSTITWSSTLIKAKEGSSDLHLPSKSSDNYLNNSISSEKVYNIDIKSSPQISPGSSCQSSPAMSPFTSPQLRRRKTLSSVTLKQKFNPSGSPLANDDNYKQESSIVRRYTLSSLEEAKLPNANLLRQLSSSPKDVTFTEAGSSSQVSEATKRFSPPGLRKSKSDLTDWRSMYQNLQGKEQAEYLPEYTLRQRSNMPLYQQSLENVPQASEVQSSKLQLPLIPCTKKGRRSQKDLGNSIPVVNHADGIQQAQGDSRIDMIFRRKNGAEKQRLLLQSEQTFPLEDQRYSSNMRRVSLPSSSRNVLDSCDVVATATTSDMLAKGWDKTPAEVTPDLLSHFATQLQPPEEPSHRHVAPRKVISSFTFDHSPSSPAAGEAEERNPSVPSGQQRVSPRLRTRTLLPPLIISQRRSPTHDTEDGYFSCSPSPADIESPRRKSSNEQPRYSFKPISPRSPIRSLQPFSSQSGKHQIYD